MVTIGAPVVHLALTDHHQWEDLSATDLLLAATLDHPRVDIGVEAVGEDEEVLAAAETGDPTADQSRGQGPDHDRRAEVAPVRIHDRVPGLHPDDVVMAAEEEEQEGVEVVTVEVEVEVLEGESFHHANEVVVAVVGRDEEDEAQATPLTTATATVVEVGVGLTIETADESGRLKIPVVIGVNLGGIKPGHGKAK